MSKQTAAPTQTLSANSKSIQKFRLAQKAKSSLFLVVIFVPLLIALSAYGIYESIVSPQADVANDLVGTEELVNDEIPINDPATITDPGSSPTASVPPPTSSNSTNQSPSSPGAAPVSSGMPQGVTVAINSIEASGLKNNTYVAANTDSIPDGVSLKADRSSWTLYTADTGSISGTISMGGETRRGSLTFQLIGGTWKVTGYSMSE